MSFSRYAVYYTPQPGPLAAFGASWLGWDMDTGQMVDHPDIDGLSMPISEITATPRKYGFHATLKPPFRLAEGFTETDLVEAVDILGSRTLHPVMGLSLELTPLGRFLALTAKGDMAQLNGLAAMCVETLDAFRAPPSDAELAKRRASGLSPRQELMLLEWGYPYVMDQFRFHMTLSGKLSKGDLAQTRAALEPVLKDVLPDPFLIDTISLVGEDDNGRFHLMHRYTLSA
jgi:putative phosphonate metabolism protein